MAINKTIQSRIEKILNWDDIRYAKFILESGKAYLYAYIRNEADEIIADIMRSKVFWNWWQLHWEARDAAFLETIVGEVSIGIARQTYQHLHDPVMLASELFPNGEVLGESYAFMIQTLTEEVVKK